MAQDPMGEEPTTARTPKPGESTVTFRVKAGFPADPKPMEVHAAVGDIKPWDADSWARFEQVGNPRARVEGPLKVTGRAKYTYDAAIGGRAVTLITLCIPATQGRGASLLMRP